MFLRHFVALNRFMKKWKIYKSQWFNMSLDQRVLQWGSFCIFIQISNFLWVQPVLNHVVQIVYIPTLCLALFLCAKLLQRSKRTFRQFGSVKASKQTLDLNSIRQQAAWIISSTRRITYIVVALGAFFLHYYYHHLACYVFTLCTPKLSIGTLSLFLLFILIYPT